MIIEIALGVILGLSAFFGTAYLLASLGRTKRLRNEQVALREAKQRELEMEEEEYRMLREEDEIYKTKKISSAKKLLESDEVKLLTKALIAKARNSVQKDGRVVYDEQWLVVLFYEHLICALWGKSIEYGEEPEDIQEVLACEQAGLISDGYLDGYASETPAGMYVRDVTGLTDSAHMALRKRRALREHDWEQTIEIGATYTVPAYASNFYRDLVSMVIADDFVPNLLAEN